MQEPQIKRFDAQTVLSIRHTGSYDEIGQVYHELYNWAREHDVKLTAPGFTVFLVPPSEFDPASAVFDVCLPVDGRPEPDARVKVQQIEASTVASVTVKGPYAQVPARYSELLAWLSVMGRDIVGPPREVYIVHPGTKDEGDRSQFITEIQFPIEA